MPDLPSRLARKWCPNHSNKRPKPPLALEKYPPCTCEAIAAAIREALEAAEKVVRKTTMESIYLGKKPVSSMCAINQAVEMLAAALAALREGRG